MKSNKSQTEPKKEEAREKLLQNLRDEHRIDYSVVDTHSRHRNQFGMFVQYSSTAQPNLLSNSMIRCRLHAKQGTQNSFRANENAQRKREAMPLT